PEPVRPARPAAAPVPLAAALPASPSRPATARASVAPAEPAGPRPAAGPKPAAAPAFPPLEPEVSGAFRRMKIEPRLATSAPPAWVGRALAALVAVLVVAALLWAPNSLMLPFPWQQRERDGLARDQRAALYLKIDQAAKTWFLLQG